MAAQMVGSMKEVADSTRETAQTVTEMAEAMTAVREMISGVGEAMLAAFAVERVVEFAKQMGEAAEKTIHTAQTFGMTAGEVQRLKGEAAGAGVSFDSVTGAMQRVDNAMTKAREGSDQQAQAFKRIGVDIKGTYDQAQLFQAAMTGLQNISDPITRVGTAMALFGRNIREVAPLLSLSKDAQTELNDTIDKYGVVSDEAMAKGGALAEEFNKNAVLSQGWGNILTSSLAPAFKVVVESINEWVQGLIVSYQGGGLVKQSMDGMVVTIKTLISAFDALFLGIDIVVRGFAIMWDGATTLARVLAVEVIGAVQQASVVLRTFGTILFDVMGAGGNPANVMKDYAKGVQDFAAISRKSAQEVAISWVEGTDKVRAGFNNIYSDAAANAERMKKLWGPDSKIELPQGLKGSAGGGVDGKGDKDKSQMGALEAAFEAQEAKATAANGGMLLNMEADAQDYWGKLRSDASLSVSDRIAVEKKYQEAVLAGYRQNAQAAVQSFRDEEQAANAAVGAQLAATKAAVTEQISAIQKAADQHIISRQAETQRIFSLIDQEKQAELDAAALIYVNRVAYDQQIMSRYAENTTEFKKAQADQTLALAENAAQQVKINAAAQTQIQKATDASVAKAVSGFRSMAMKVGDDWRTTVEGLIEKTTSWRQVFVQIQQQMLDMFLRIVEQMVVKWAAAQFAQVAAAQTAQAAKTATATAGAAQSQAANATSNMAQIKSDAATAAGAAYKALAGIPLIGPALGAAAAAATFAAVMGFESMASAAGGWGQVPEDQIAQVHKDEMILPANLASGFRSILAAATLPSMNAAQAAAAPLSAVSPAFGSAGGGGDIHAHFSAMDGKSVQRFFDQHSDKLAKSLQRATRNTRASFA